MDYKQKYEQAIENLRKIKAANKDNKSLVDFIEYEYPELQESENEKIRKEILDCFKTMKQQGCFPSKHKEQYDSWVAWLEKQSEQVSNEPNWIHHKVNLSNCSEEYIKAYYDGWNNCNQQHSQLKAEQKPAWSEEDKRMLQDIISGLESVKHLIFKYDSQGKTQIQSRINWLKSLKEIMKGETK